MAHNEARRMWTLFEPLHAVTYFAPGAREHFEAIGLRGFWRGYFAGRSAPLGRVEAAPITAAFFNFAPVMVSRALPAIWSLASPEEALAARTKGAVASLADLLSGLPEKDIAEAADLLAEALTYVDTSGRVLAAANAALPVPDEPLARVWHATTVLREHRGDGHVAALVAWELSGIDALVWRTSLDLSRDVLQPARGWTDEEWEESVRRLTARGWLDLNRQATDIAAQAHRDIEGITDRAASRPWAGLGERNTERLTSLLIPMAQAAFNAIPDYNPIGLPAPLGE